MSTPRSKSTTEGAVSPTGAKPTQAVHLGHIEAVVNVAAGSVGPHAGEALRTIVEGFGLQVHVAEVQPSGIDEALRAAVDAKPDLLIVLAGDGTARHAAELCGPDGPMVAPLPGGTMNMLPHAIYGVKPWREALAETLAHGEARIVSGGEIHGRHFYVAAILGAPALWADAREAVRALKPLEAVARARHALNRAFAGRLRFTLQGRVSRKAEALTLMCPLVSKNPDHTDGLEADALDPQNVAEAARLGLKAALGGPLGDWRKDPAVTTELCFEGRAWAHGRIPAILDGEPCHLPRKVQFHFKSHAFRTFAPPAAMIAAQAQPKPSPMHGLPT